MGEFGFLWATVPDWFGRFAPAPPLYASVPGAAGMTQDRYGYLWIATRENLYRCDGLRYMPFDRDSSQRPFSGRLKITGITGGRHGVLCLFTETDELLFYDVRENTRRFASLKKRASKEDLHITCVSEDASGRFWFGSREGDVLRISPPDTVVEWAFRYAGEVTGTASTVIRAIAQDSLGQFWIGGDRGLLRLRQETAAENRFRCDTVRGLSSVGIAGLLVARSGRIWICGIDRRVGWLDPVSKKFTPVKALGQYLRSRVSRGCQRTGTGPSGFRFVAMGSSD